MRALLRSPGNVASTLGAPVTSSETFTGLTAVFVRSKLLLSGSDVPEALRSSTARSPSTFTPGVLTTLTTSGTLGVAARTDPPPVIPGIDRGTRSRSAGATDVSDSTPRIAYAATRPTARRAAAVSPRPRLTGGSLFGSPQRMLCPFS
jgi:hypothetical protein